MNLPQEASGSRQLKPSLPQSNSASSSQVHTQQSPPSHSHSWVQPRAPTRESRWDDDRQSSEKKKARRAEKLLDYLRMLPQMPRCRSLDYPHAHLSVDFVVALPVTGQSIAFFIRSWYRGQRREKPRNDFFKWRRNIYRRWMFHRRYLWFRNRIRPEKAYDGSSSLNPSK